MKFQRIPYLVDAEQIEQGRVPALLESVPAFLQSGRKTVINWMIAGDYLHILDEDGNYLQALDEGDWLVMMPSGRLRKYTDRDFRLLFEEIPA